MWKQSRMQKLSPVPKVLLDSLTLRSWGGSRGLRDRETGRVTWNGRKWKKMLELNAKGYVRGFWIARLHSWVGGQDTYRTARRMPNANTDTVFFFVHLSLSSFPLVRCTVSLFPSPHSVLVLYIPPCRRASFMLPSSWILSYIFNSLSELILSLSFFLCLSFCFPLPLCNSWHSILPAE